MSGQLAGIRVCRLALLSLYVPLTSTPLLIATFLTLPASTSLINSVKVISFLVGFLAAFTTCQSSTSTQANMTQKIPVLMFEFTWNLRAPALAYARSSQNLTTERLAD